MNIQVISEYFYPDSFRINEIVCTLTTAGHAVQVLTALPDYTTGHIPVRYKHFKNRREVCCGAPTIRIPATERRTGTMRRMLNYFTFMVNASIYAIFCKCPHCDVIFVYETSPIFQALPALILKKRTKKKVVLYCCDLWPESLKVGGIQENSWIYKAVKRFSQWLYRGCDIVAITSKPFKSYLMKTCQVSEQAIVYLPQHASDDYSSIAGQYNDNDCIDFMFAGNIGAAQNLDCVLTALTHIHTTKKYHIHLVGNGSELAHLKKLASELGVEPRVSFHGHYPASEMKSWFLLADCFLLTLDGTSSVGKTLPGKAQTYLSIGKPVVGAINGAGAEMIKESDCGLCVPAGDAIALAEAMTEVIENFEKYKLNGQKGRNFYEKNYTMDVFIHRLLKILQQ